MDYIFASWYSTSLNHKESFIMGRRASTINLTDEETEYL